MSHLSNAAVQFRDIPTLGFTHYQPAQLTTYTQPIPTHFSFYFCVLNDIFFFSLCICPFEVSESEYVCGFR